MNKKIKSALCSFGMSGRIFHAPLISNHSGFELYGVLERTGNHAAQHYPGIHTFRKYKDLLADSNIDLVVVNVPNHLHVEFCKAAIEAKKDVLVEKPFTLTLAEAIALRDLAKYHNKRLYVFQNRRWDSDFLSIQKLIASEKLGEIVEFEAHFDRFRPIPTTGTWKEDETLGTGLLYNLGAHLIDQALVLFGLPDEVFADLGTLRPGSKICDYFTLILYYQKKRAVLRSSYVVKHHPAKYLIHGTQGSFIKPGQDPQEARLDAGWPADHPDIGMEAEADWGSLFIDDREGSEVLHSQKGNYLQFYDTLQQDLWGQSTQAVTADEGLKVMQVIETARISQEKGKRIKLLTI